jgi:hypothetical protein
MDCVGSVRTIRMLVLAGLGAAGIVVVNERLELAPWVAAAWLLGWSVCALPGLVRARAARRSGRRTSLPPSA